MNRPEQDLDHPLDSAIRHALEPKAQEIRRTINRAMGKPTSAHGNQKKRLVAAAAGIAIVIAVGIGVLLRPTSSVPAMPEESVPVVANHSGGILITNKSGLVTVAAPDGQIMAIVSGETP
ncbi:MAG: hypothetical protein GY906_00065 [bacterium]|nr:hypothetical protein [bacterium]